jgi:uncharacterized membrane protein
VEEALTDETNKAVLGTTEVVRAATTGTLRGTVKDDNGRPLAGVQVLAMQQDVRVNVAGNPATTDANGIFRIDKLPIGETTVTAALNSSEVAKITTNIVAIVTINLQLKPTSEIELTPSTLAFGEVQVGGARTRRVTVSNAGTKDLTITAFTLENARSSAFSLDQGPTLPVDIAPGASTTVSISYQPTAAGATTGTLRVASNALNASEGTVVLRGSGVPIPTSQVEVDPPALTFGEVQVRTDQDVSVTKSVTIRNAGTATLTLSALQTEPAEFTLGQGSTAPVPVAPGAAVTVEVRFRPRNAGTFTGTLRITSDAANTREARVTLSGKGVAAAVSQISVTPTRLDFREVTVGQDQTLAVTIRNSGTADLTLSRLVVEGDASAAFAVQNAPTLPVPMAPGATVAVQLRYRPSTAGTVTGTLRVDSNANNTPRATVSLNGTGVAASQPQLTATPPQVAFGNVPVGQTRTSQVTVTNAGTADLMLTRLTVGGDAALTLGTAPTLPTRLAPKATATVEVRFRPSRAEASTGTLRVDSNTSNTPQVTIPLSGTGR